MSVGIKQVVKSLLPPILLDAARTVLDAVWTVRDGTERDVLQSYLRGGKVPWTPGYSLYRAQLIRDALSDVNLLGRFRRGEPLPSDFGVGIDERIVEYPWFLSHMQNRPETLLDAGSTLNHEFILDQPVIQGKVLHILTLAPEGSCFWRRCVSYLFHDLRDILIRDGYYDSIACLSTLEHVGCDNRLYVPEGTPQERRPEDFLLVVKELRRVLKPGGALFLTVPFGTYRHFESFQQFDQSLLSRAIDAFGRTAERLEVFYRYSGKGWNVATADDCAECEYVEWITWPHDQWPNPLPVEPDLAAASRAVACIYVAKV